jgi:hypothetical protein
LRLITVEDLTLLEWGLRQRALCEQISALLLALSGPRAARDYLPSFELPMRQTYTPKHAV